jgi:hypothetical protein
VDKSSGWLICRRTHRRWVVGPGRTVRIEFEWDGARHVGLVRDVGPDGVYFEMSSELHGLRLQRPIDGVTIRFETGEIHGDLVLKHVTDGIGAPRGCGASFTAASDADRGTMERFLRGLDHNNPDVDTSENSAEDPPPRVVPGERRIRVQTAQGAIEGTLPVGQGSSTMHRLNVVAASQKFLQLQSPVVCTPKCVFQEGALSVVIDSIVFVTEVAECVPVPREPQAAARFRRARVILLLEDYLVEGYVHVPPGGDPIVRLNQDRHKFIALTSVTVKTADEEFSAPFMALNGSKLLAIQEIEDTRTPEVEPAGRATA